MIVENITQAVGPSSFGMLMSASLWVVSMMIMLVHRSGIQIVGAGVALIGLVSLITADQIILSLLLLALGLFIHSCGRLLLYLRRR